MAAKPVIVYRCDCCGRVAAELCEDGTLVLYQRHDGEQHTTIITPPAQPERPSTQAPKDES